MNRLKDDIKTHPDKIALLAYMEDPGQEGFRDIRQHLLVCALCRKQVSSLQVVMNDLKRFPIAMEEMADGFHPDELILADFVDGRIPQDQLREIKEHITGCSFCTRAAFHYATHSAEAERAGIAPVSVAPASSKITVFEGVFDRLISAIRRFFSRRVPAIAIPATALAVFLLVYFTIKGTEDTRKIIAYQERPEVVFTPPGGAPPGIGFFGSARELTEPFEGITIQQKDDEHLKVRWPKVKTALLYEFKVYASEDGNRRLIGEAKTTSGTEVTLQVLGMMSPGKAYEWELSGSTENRGSFITRGGLVMGIQVRF